MITVVIEKHSRVLGAPAGWTPETSGECYGLPIGDGMNGDQPCMVSAWEPTPAEIERIVAGEKIYLSVIGTGHPPVMLYVGNPFA